MVINQKKSVIKKYVLIVVMFLVISLLCVPLYNYFKYTNNQLQNEILSLTIEDSLLGKNDELLMSVNFYYNLAILTKWIGVGAFFISFILFIYVIYNKFIYSKIKQKSSG